MLILSYCVFFNIFTYLLSIGIVICRKDSNNEDIRKKYHEMTTSIYFNRTLCPNITHNQTFEKFQSLFTEKELKLLMDDNELLKNFLISRMCKSNVIQKISIKVDQKDNKKSTTNQSVHNIQDIFPSTKLNSTREFQFLQKNLTQEINSNITRTKRYFLDDNFNETGEYGDTIEPFDIENYIVWDPTIDKDGLIGCYRDGNLPLRDMPLRTHGFPITPLNCRQSCFTRNFRYAAVQYGYLCFCGNTYGNYGEAEMSDCLTPCHGNYSLACGSFWRNLIYNATINDFKWEKPNMLSKRSFNLNYTEINTNATVNSTSTNNSVSVKHSNSTTSLNPIPTLNSNTTSFNKYNQIVINSTINVTQHPKILISNSTFQKHNANKKPSNTTIQLSINNSNPFPTTIKPPKFNSSNVVEDFNLTLETIPKSFVSSNKDNIVYIGQFVAKQRWFDDYNKTNTPKYQIFVGNIIKALNKTFGIYHNLKGVQILKMRPKHIGNFYSNPRTVILFMVSFNQHFSINNIDPIEYLDEKINQDEKIYNMPVYSNYFTMKLKSEAEPLFDDHFPFLKTKYPIKKKSTIPIEIINENRDILKEFFKNEVLDRRRRQTDKLTNTLASNSTVDIIPNRNYTTNITLITNKQETNTISLKNILNHLVS